MLSTKANAKKTLGMQKNSRIFVAGHNGLVGSALIRRMKTAGYNNIIIRTRKELDLTNTTATYKFFKENKIDREKSVFIRVTPIWTAFKWS